ncbi:non-ribosomal peptide synthetase [Pseudoalteromonas rubra]|uniref:Carrier domain-containing protein n=1 Tax=Pseudoalteromonas rubra TaxID=43658 RepID=A0A0F4QTZ2_9GAMM|nr:non-ribosomal peptide synthetase [Pseudoalteromonas rubra]KJZ11133.1 hypothetical protein TW77_06325 [Pseudoalteromonas rubra]
MENVVSVINRLVEQGVEVYLSQGKLKARSVKGGIGPQNLELIKQHKFALIEYLEGRSGLINNETGCQAITRAESKDSLSFAQQRLWFIDELQGGSPEYNMSFMFDVRGMLDIELVEKSLTEIVRRHEILRTVYVNCDGEAKQCTLEDVQFKLRLHDLSLLGEEEKASQLKHLLDLDVETPYDLSADLMVRASYIQLVQQDASAQQAQQGLLLFNMHHIASDGWSMEVLYKEFFALYHAFSEGKPTPLSELDIQYSDYAHWQRQWLQGERLEAQLNYWDKQLAAVPCEHGLKLDFPRPEPGPRIGGEVYGQLSAQTAVALQNLSKKFRLTPFMLLHSMLALVLSRHSNSSDIVIGTPVANRMQTELEPLIGFFVNTLVLRADTDWSSLGEYLQHIRQLHLDAQSNQDVPFEQLVERLKVPRNTGSTPVFQVMLTTNTDFSINSQQDKSAFALPGICFSPVIPDTSIAKFDLDISIEINASGVSTNWTYDTALFTEQHVQQLKDHLCRLLEGLATLEETGLIAKHTPLKSLPLLSSQETHQLLNEINTPLPKYDTQACIHELFEKQVLLHGDKVAVRYLDSALTYQALNERANKLAHYLIDKYEIKPDTLVGICVDRSLDMILAILAVLKAGAAYVPLDPSYPKSRLDYMLADAELSLVLTQSQVTQEIDFKGRDLVVIDDQSHLNTLQRYSSDNVAKQALELNSEHLAYVIYTSGSTGQPKGVLQTHTNVNRLFTATAEQFNFSDADIWTLFHSFSFDFSVWEIWGALLHGGTLIIPTKDCTLDTRQFIQLCQTHGVTVLNQTPSAFNVFSEQVLNESRTLHDLRYIVFGGEQLSRSHIENWVDEFGYDTPKLVNMYGITETTVHVTFNLLNEHNLGSIGKPLADQSILILDNQMNLTPVGCVGEMYVSGNGLARGYLNKPDVTAERFLTNPYFELAEPGRYSGRVYKTGDLARYLADGSIEFVGRVDEQVKIRGFRIELGEIESAVGRYEAVDKVKVVQQTQSALEKNLVAYFSLNTDEIEQRTRAIDKSEVSQWEEVFDNTYSSEADWVQPGSDSNDMNNIVGWDCSYRKSPIGAPEMLEWVEGTVAQINALAPKNVLEIGVGTGMLLTRYAGRCDSVTGLDISQNALDYLEGVLARRDINNVALIKGDATYLSQFENTRFDCIILNSVAQYFSSDLYFNQVLDNMLSCLDDGGKLFIGDVRNLDLLASFKHSITVFQADGEVSKEKLYDNANAAIHRENELLISPCYFYNLVESNSAVSSVDIKVKKGCATNEMMRYRYDVVIYKNARKADRLSQWQEWIGVTELSRLLQQGAACFGVSNAPNKRIEADVRLENQLTDDSTFDFHAVKAAIRLEPCSFIGDLDRLAAENGYTMECTWSQLAADKLDLIFTRKDEVTRPAILSRYSYNAVKLINKPQLGKISNVLIPEVKRYISGQLPKHLLPDAYILLEDFPINFNGKLDLKKLPKVNVFDDKGYVVPQTEMEGVLQAAWQQVLNQEKVSADADFFEVGGNSLLAVRLVSEIRQHLEIDMPVKAVFEHSGLQAMAVYVDDFIQSAQLLSRMNAMPVADKADEIEW